MENIESKYYTPDIKEFRVGFEYEFYNECWHDTLFDANIDLIKIYENIKNFRVKYLDRSDIEELGYKLIKERGNPDEKIYLNYVGVLHFSNEDQEKLFTQISMYLYTDGTSDLKVAQYERTSNTTKQRSGPIFEGIVKNKSELKVLLKQLGL